MKKQMSTGNHQNEFERKTADAMTHLGFVPNEGRPIGVAFSGGADSTALLVALRRCGYSVVGLHCNFHLRGDESDQDARFCRCVCDIEGIELESVDFDVDRSRRGGESVEMCCRRLRYEWFESIALTLGLSAVALAHHREDSVETVFLNLFRGTGPRGLRGIQRRRDRYVRPLLDFSRREIEDYLRDVQLTYRTDSTNLSNEYRRNRLRNELIPAIEAAFPDAGRGILKTADEVGASFRLLEGLVDVVSRDFFDGDSIDLERLVAIPVDSVQLLFYAAARCFPPGLNLSTVRDILVSRSMSGLRFLLTDGSELELDYGHLRRKKSQDDRDMIPVSLTDGSTWPFPVEIEMIGHSRFMEMEKGPGDLFLDSSAADGSPVVGLRRWHRGDRLKPFGMKGSRLVSDIFSDRKLPASSRRLPLILTHNGEILWVAGIRASRLFHVTPDSRTVIHIRATVCPDEMFYK